MHMKKALSLIAVVGLGFALSVAVLERKGTTAAVGPQIAGLANQMSS